MALKGNLFMSPERVVFGCGVIDDMGIYVKQLGGKKPFIATDKIISAVDAFQRLEDSVKKDHTYGNPRIPTREQLEALYEQVYMDL